MVVTAAYIWFRSPRKGRVSLIILVGAIVAAIVASSIDGSTRGDDTNSNFWVEMSTMFQAGGTRADREVLWGAARKVFQNHPILGAGPSNFGVAAANELHVGDVGGNYADNPKVLYSRALHNIYYQTLSEQGIVGFAILLALIAQFWIRNRALTRRAAAAQWRALGGEHDLGAIARGLECGLVTFLACGWFYNMFLVSGFWGLIIANTVLYRMTRRRGNRAPPLTAGSSMIVRSDAKRYAFTPAV
jgi:O-antigen ligase